MDVDGVGRGSEMDASRSDQVDPTLPAWARDSGLELPACVSFTRLQWVVSPRLLTVRRPIDALLHEAADSAGLRILQGPGLPAPSKRVATAADAAWVAWPGRYCVARKCDGMRHVLFVSRDGKARLQSRSGAVYEYPLHAARADGSGSRNLPPGSVLDGELVWVGGRGFFLAFDAIVVGERRAWQERLPARLALLSDAAALGLVEAEVCDELCQAAAAGNAARCCQAAQSQQQGPRLHKKQQAPALESDAYGSGTWPSPPPPWRNSRRPGRTAHTPPTGSSSPPWTPRTRWEWRNCFASGSLQNWRRAVFTWEAAAWRGPLGALWGEQAWSRG